MTYIVLVLCFTALVIDLFIPTQFLSACALFVMNAYFAWLFFSHVSWVWSILAFCVSTIISSALYYMLFKYLVNALLYKWAARNAPDETIHRIVGQMGNIHFVEGKPLLKWNDELWPIQNLDDMRDLHEGLVVRITALEDGQVTITSYKLSRPE